MTLGAPVTHEENHCLINWICIAGRPLTKALGDMAYVQITARDQQLSK